MKTLYCKNYKGIHHTINLVMFVFALYFLGIEFLLKWQFVLFFINIIDNF